MTTRPWNCSRFCVSWNFLLKLSKIIIYPFSDQYIKSYIDTTPTFKLTPTLKQWVESQRLAEPRSLGRSGCGRSGLQTCGCYRLVLLIENEFFHMFYVPVTCYWYETTWWLLPGSTSSPFKTCWTVRSFHSLPRNSSVIRHAPHRFSLQQI
jgi:hypothetical protein